MIKRVIGWILFLWMDAWLYSLFANQPLGEVAADPAKLATGLVLFAFAALGILMGFGILFPTRPTAEPPAN